MATIIPRRLKLAVTIAAAAGMGALMSRDLPLAYCLFCDPKAPVKPKLEFAGTLTAMVPTVSLGWMGSIDVFLAGNVLSAYIAKNEEEAPSLVALHRHKLADGTSLWDVHRGAGIDLGKTIFTKIDQTLRNPAVAGFPRKAATIIPFPKRQGLD